MAKVALVTGGSRGIGRAVCLRLAEDGFTVVVNYAANRAAAEEVCTLICQHGSAEALAVQADVSNVDDVKQLFATVQRSYGGVDVLINNAGVTGDGLFLFTRNDVWWRTVEVNLGSVVNCCRQVLPSMMKKKAGVIVNVTSVSGQRGRAGQTAYSASKAAIVGFSKSLAREVSRYGIVVNCVSPGFVETDMLRAGNQDVIGQHLSALPLQRMGRPEEIAEVIALLAGGRAGYLFGQVIAVDGGATM